MRCTNFWNIEPEPGTKPGRTSSGFTTTQVKADEPSLFIEKWGWHFEALQALRESLLKHKSLQSADVRSPLESHSMHPADSASDEFDHDLALAMLAGKERALFEVDAALRRILEGTYGVCQESGNPISEARLRALPWTRYTKEVAERLERQHAMTALVSPVE